MQPPLLTKLQRGAVLDEQDSSLLKASLGKIQRFQARQEIIETGARPEGVHVIMSGFAARHKSLPDGQREIVALLLPGDTCDLNVFLFGHMDHGLVALSACEVAYLSADVVRSLLMRPALAHALWWSTLVDESTLREWLLSLGQRSAEQAMAHLFCELHLRLAVVGLATESSFRFPLTQNELADMLGITAVHTNRVLRQLRTTELITLSGGRLTILDVERLRAFCDFDPSYLHLTPRSPYPGYHQDYSWTVNAS